MTTPTDAAQVLAKISLCDPLFPKPDANMARAWAEVFSVHGLDLPDLLAGVTALFADDTRASRDRVLPADVIRKARAIRRERAERDDAETRAAREAAIDAKIEAAQRRAVEQAASSQAIG